VNSCPEYKQQRYAYKKNRNMLAFTVNKRIYDRMLLQGSPCEYIFKFKLNILGSVELHVQEISIVAISLHDLHQHPLLSSGNIVIYLLHEKGGDIL